MLRLRVPHQSVAGERAAKTLSICRCQVGAGMETNLDVSKTASLVSQEQITGRYQCIEER